MPYARAVAPSLIATVLLLAQGAVSAQTRPPQRVLVPADRLERFMPDLRARGSVTVLSAAGVDTAQVTARGVQLQRGEFAVLTTDETQQIDGPQPAAGTDSAGATGGLPFHALPFRLVTPDSALTGEWVLRPIYKVASRLRWAPESDQFEGVLFLAVEDTSRRRESRPLPVPIRFELLSDADTVDPASIAVEHTNFPLQRVRILARFAADSVRVHVVPEFDVSGADVWIPVEPSLTLAAPRRIQGWGIQTARVVARVVGTGSVRPTTLALTTSGGELDSTRITIDASGSAETRIRSEGIGTAIVEAGGPGLSAATVAIDFTFPWIFLLAALLGGVFGGLAAAAHKRKGRQKTRWAQNAIKGVFAGVIAALAWYALGISLLQFDLGMARFNELAVFTLAALAGYFGIPRPKPETA
jgi:hypothetical protein